MCGRMGLGFWNHNSIQIICFLLFTVKSVVCMKLRFFFFFFHFFFLTKVHLINIWVPSFSPFTSFFFFVFQVRFCFLYSTVLFVFFSIN